MLAFSPDGRTMASGSEDNNVILWDVLTGEDLMTLKHNGRVEALRFSPDGRILATAAHEPARGDVCLWRAPLDDDGTQNSLRPASGPVFSDRSTSLDSSTAARASYPDATSVPSAAASYSQQPFRKPLDPSAPLPSSGYSDSSDDRYGAAAMPVQGAGIAPAFGGASADPSVPIGAGNGISQPVAEQGNGATSPHFGGRPARPAGQ
jgi:hypothetical protein